MSSSLLSASFALMFPDFSNRFQSHFFMWFILTDMSLGFFLTLHIKTTTQLSQRNNIIFKNEKWSPPKSFLFCWPVNLSEFHYDGQVWCYNTRGRQRLNHIDKLPMLRNSSFGCFILVHSVTSRRDRRELVWDRMAGQVQMSWAECQRVAL